MRYRSGMNAIDVATVLCGGMKAVYANRLRAIQRIDGTSVVTVPQPTLEGGDISIFVETTDNAIIIHDNGRTAMELESLGIVRRSQVERLARERGCDYESGRLQAVVPVGGDLVSPALRLADAIKTVSDLGLML